jgi:hypothetical protein
MVFVGCTAGRSFRLNTGVVSDTAVAKMTLKI